MSKITRRRPVAVAQPPKLATNDEDEFKLPEIPRLLDPLFQPINRFLTSPGTQRFAIRTVFIVAALLAVFGAAFLGYACFYYTYIPEVKHVQPVWFQHSSGTVPTAHVDLTRHGRYNPPLRHDQSYLISVDLDVPTSQRNLDVGNFMVTVWLQSAKNQTVQFSSRPTILKYRSPLTRVLYTLWRAIPLVLNFSQESQRLSVIIIEGFYEIESNPVTQAIVTLSDPRLQVYDAMLRLDADFRGIRYLMYYWPLTATAFFISIFLFWEFAFAVLAWRLFGRAWWAALDSVDSNLPSATSTPLEGDDYDNEDPVDDNLWYSRNGFETDSDVDIPRPGQPSAGTEALASLTTAYRNQQQRHQQFQPQQQQQQRQLALHKQYIQQQQQLAMAQARGPQNPPATTTATSYSSYSSFSRPSASTAATSVPAAPAIGRPIRQATSSAGSAARPVSATPLDYSIDSELTENTASEYEEEVDGERLRYGDQEVPPTPSTVDNLTTPEEYTESESDGDRVMAG